MILTLIVIVVLILLVFAIVMVTYNGLVRLNQQAEEAWSDITVQLKRRYDLIPNLVNTVKGYAAHEKTVFEDVTTARSKAMNSSGVAETAQAENQFSSTLKSLFAVAENYPQLQATQNFQELQTELVDTEDKIQASRRFYNSVVRDFNTRRRTFPTKIYASIAGYRKDKDYFELDESQEAQVEQPVDVKF
jgi:LemA protein